MLRATVARFSFWPCRSTLAGVSAKTSAGAKVSDTRPESSSASTDARRNGSLGATLNSAGAFRVSASKCWRASVDSTAGATMLSTGQACSLFQ